ncbi:ras-related protein Rab-34-like [Watersipora subatra]|uniref:ras-related protein Rab-34-like n=1 Tax=Watersipora subatra TaxID=2589382 RepID=UPI00355B5E42
MSGQPIVAKDRVITSFPRPYNVQTTPYKAMDYDPIVRSACQRDRTNIGVKLCKAVVVGDVAIGKTSFVNRFCHDLFDKDYKATIGVDFEVEKFNVMSLPFTVQLWDTAGQERFRCIAASYYRGANAIIVGFDLCDVNTLQTARTWYEDAAKAADQPIVFLVGMKKDKLSPAAYKSTEAEALRLAEQIGAEYWATSSMTGESVKQLMFRLVALTFNQMVKLEMSERNAQTTKSIGTLKVTKTKDLYEKKKKKRSLCA